MPHSPVSPANNDERNLKANTNCISDGSKISVLKKVKVSIYFISILILLPLLILQTYRLIAKYLEGPTYISTEIVGQNEAQFPAITICKDGGGYKEEVLARYGIPKEDSYNYLQIIEGPLTWHPNDSSVSAQQLFDDATYQLHEIANFITFRHIYADEKGSVTFRVPLKDFTGKMIVHPATNQSLQEQRHRKFGKCYTINLSDAMKNLGIYYMKFGFKQNVKLYIHAPNQYLDFSGRMGIKIRIGEDTQSQVTYQDIVALPKERKDGTMSCSMESYDSCMYNTLAHLMLNSSGCTVPWIPRNSKICQDPAGINSTYWIAWNRVTNQKKDCNVPCSFLMVQIGAKNFRKIDSNSSTLYFYFPPRVSRSEEHELYTVLSLLAEIGGYTGLLLGYSAFNFASFLITMIDKKIKSMEKMSSRPTSPNSS